MAKGYPVGFKILIPEPVEVKMISLTIKVRDSIAPLERFKGLFTYVVEDDTFYYLSGGIKNSNWKPIGVPQKIEIYDEFQDKPQTVISGQGIKSYLEEHYYTKSELDQELARLEVPLWVKAITAEQIQTWDSIQGDISERLDFPNAKTIWSVIHPKGKNCQPFNSQGQEIIGRKTSINDTTTIFNWSRPLSGFVKIN